MTLHSKIVTAEGQDLESFGKILTPVDLMSYGAATWDWYACHYNDAAAHALGLPGPFVDGQMWGAWFARQLRAHCGPRAFVRGMKLRYHALCLAGDEVICRGRITGAREEDGETILEIAQTIVKPGDAAEIRVASCVSTVVLPAEHASDKQGDLK